MEFYASYIWNESTRELLNHFSIPYVLLRRDDPREYRVLIGGKAVEQSDNGGPNNEDPTPPPHRQFNPPRSAFVQCPFHSHWTATYICGFNVNCWSPDTRNDYWMYSQLLAKRMAVHSLAHRGVNANPPIRVKTRSVSCEIRNERSIQPHKGPQTMHLAAQCDRQCNYPLQKIRVQPPISKFYQPLRY